MEEDVESSSSPHLGIQSYLFFRRFGDRGWIDGHGGREETLRAVAIHAYGAVRRRLNSRGSSTDTPRVRFRVKSEGRESNLYIERETETTGKRDVEKEGGLNTWGLTSGAAGDELHELRCG